MIGQRRVQKLVLGLPSVPVKKRKAFLTLLPLKIADHKLLKVPLAANEA
jgi:hypothetical protein